MKKNSLLAIATIVVLGIILLFFLSPWDDNTEQEDKQSEENKSSDKKFGFIMTIDEERYKWSEEEENVLVLKEGMVEGYPEVSMKIEQFPSTAPEKILPELETKMREEYSSVSEPESILEPVKGFKLHGIDQENGNSDWDSPVINIYVIDNGQDGSFVITEKYFLEAAEGHGKHFYHMLETFEIKVLAN